MKCHPGWLAGGLLLSVVLACNVGKNSNSSNSNANGNRPADTSANTNTRRANPDVYVEEVHMAKDDDGKPGETTTVFAPSERTVFCVISLNKAKGGTNVGVKWIAQDVQGAKDQELKSLEYTTKPFENKVNGHLTWSQDWPQGTYKLDVYINGELDKTITYTVQ